MAGRSSDSVRLRAAGHREKREPHDWRNYDLWSLTPSRAGLMLARSGARVALIEPVGWGVGRASPFCLVCSPSSARLGGGGEEQVGSKLLWEERMEPSCLCLLRIQPIFLWGFSFLFPALFIYTSVYIFTSCARQPQGWKPRSETRQRTQPSQKVRHRHH